MKALTLWGPWSSLLMSGVKLHETRPWRTPPALIGQRIAIHASQRKMRPIELAGDLHDLCYREFGPTYLTTLPLGVVLGFATIKSCVPVEDIRDTISDDDRTAGNWRNWRFAWEMTDVRVLPEPIPAKGFQRIWNWNGEES